MKLRQIAKSTIDLVPDVRFEVDIPATADKEAHTKWINNKDNDPADQVVMEMLTVPNKDRGLFQKFGESVGGGMAELINDYDGVLKKYCKKIRGLEDAGITNGETLVAFVPDGGADGDTTWQIEAMIKEGFNVAMGTSTAGRESAHMSSGEANASV